jgi:hypothetical protein
MIGCNRVYSLGGIATSLLNRLLMPCAVAAMFAASAHASLIFNTGIHVTGTGLGAVNTLVTVHDPGGSPPTNSIEGGCISLTAGGADTETCAPGTEITEQDNQALNQTIAWSDLDFETGFNIAAVVNVSETGEDNAGVVLTGLYLSFYNAQNVLYHTAQYLGADLPLFAGEGTGLGASGFTFSLDGPQLTAVLAGGPVRIGGGVQFAEGTTFDGSETLHVLAFDPLDPQNPIPEPSTYLMLGGGLISLGLWRRRQAQNRKA